MIRPIRARLEDKGKKVERFWRHLPRRLQAKLVVYGFVSFEDMLIIDDQGDPEYTDPHIFIDFAPTGPFQYSVANLVQGHTTIHEGEFRKFKQVKIFPPTFPEPRKGEVHDLDNFGLDAEVARSLEYLKGPATLYSFDGRLKALDEGSLLRIPKKDQNSSDKHAEVTHLYKTTVGALLKELGSEHYRSQLQSSAGREITDTDKVTVVELYEVMLPFEGNHVNYLDHDWNW